MRRIVDFFDGLDETRIAGTIKYRCVSSPEQFEPQLALAMAHWFNHQPRHGGQVHALLTGLVGVAQELDFLFVQRPSAKPAARKNDNFTPSCAESVPGNLGLAGAYAAKLRIPPVRPPNILKERVLFVSSEFHFGSKQATT